MSRLKLTAIRVKLVLNAILFYVCQKTDWITRDEHVSWKSKPWRTFAEDLCLLRHSQSNPTVYQVHFCFRALFLLCFFAVGRRCGLSLFNGGSFGSITPTCVSNDGSSKPSFRAATASFKSSNTPSSFSCSGPKARRIYFLSSGKIVYSIFANAWSNFTASRVLNSPGGRSRSRRITVPNNCIGAWCTFAKACTTLTRSVQVRNSNAAWSFSWHCSNDSASLSCSLESRTWNFAKAIVKLSSSLNVPRLRLHTLWTSLSSSFASSFGPGRRSIWVARPVRTGQLTPHLASDARVELINLTSKACKWRLTSIDNRSNKAMSWLVNFAKP